VHFSFKALILPAQSARKMSALSPFVRVARMGCSLSNRFSPREARAETMTSSKPESLLEKQTVKIQV
jgi:hypothetical protein